MASPDSVPSYPASDDACRVLVVDDDELVRTRLAALLRVFHYQVEVAAGGDEALRTATDRPCDIVLTDWQMPDMDGLALCRRLRRLQHEGYLYVVMLSVRGGERNVLMGLAAGADDYVVKGASVDEMLARLEIGRRITRASRVPIAGPWSLLDDSQTDATTGAYNLRYVFEHLPRELARAQRHGFAVAVITVTLQPLPPDTDADGAEAQHARARDFLAHMSGVLRQSDWCARTSPGEFMVVLPETSVQGAHIVADKLLRVFSASTIAPPTALRDYTVDLEVSTVAGRTDEQPTRRRPADLERLMTDLDITRH
jgi:diguanylate cyclase (GGDEF)-like protein